MGLLALPPGFRALAGGGDPFGGAVRAAGEGAEPGLVLWDGGGGVCRAGFVFAPDRAAGGVDVVLQLGLVALYDALAVMAPPQVPLGLALPDGVLVDGGRVATLVTRWAAAVGDAVPEWAVLGVEVAVDLGEADPGRTPDGTCLREEGFGEVTPGEVLGHLCRHLLGWLDDWREEGAGALARGVAARLAVGALA